MGFVDWKAKDGGRKEFGGSGGAGSDFMKLEINKTYKLRMIGKPYEYFQHWEPVICRSPGIQGGQVLDPLMLEQKNPAARYACWFLNREDNSLKIVDFPGSLLDSFLDWAKAFNAEPGGRNGCDWQVKREGNANDPRKSKYKAMPLDRAPFTEEELAMINAKGDLAKILEEFRKPNTPDEIRRMLSEKRGGKASEGAGHGGTTQKTATSAPKAPPAPPKDEEEIPF